MTAINDTLRPAEAAAQPGEFRRGWALLLAATLGSAAGLSSIPFYSLGSFIAPLQAELGWSRGDISISFLYTTVVLALISPVLGALIDRYGVRKLALFSIPGLAAVLYLISRYEGTVTGFHALYALAAVTGAATTPINYTKAVNGAFDKSRGLALGISQGGIALAAIGLPLLLAGIIPTHGWRTAYYVLALLALVPWPFILFGMSARTPRQLQVRATDGYTAKEALATQVFWVFGLAFALIAIAVSALVVHLVPLLRDAGMSPLQAASTASMIGIGVLCGRLVTGFLLDRFFAPYVAAALFIAAAAGCLLLVLVGTSSAVVAAGLIGLALGAEADLIAYITSRYFGLARYGLIYSLIYSMFVVGAAVGPALAGIAFDASGSYRTTLWGIIGLLVVGSLVIMKLPRFEAVARRSPT